MEISRFSSIVPLPIRYQPNSLKFSTQNPYQLSASRDDVLTLNSSKYKSNILFSGHGHASVKEDGIHKELAAKTAELPILQKVLDGIQDKLLDAKNDMKLRSQEVKKKEEIATLEQEIEKLKTAINEFNKALANDPKPKIRRIKTADAGDGWEKVDTSD